jgi:hypothetical protein
MEMNFVAVYNYFVNFNKNYYFDDDFVFLNLNEKLFIFLNC